MRKLQDENIEHKIVLARTDYNVPIETTEDGERIIASDLRIRASLPTLEYLRSHGADKVIIISHLGRPEGKDEKFSLKLVAERLAELMPGTSVSFVDEVSGPEVEAAVEDLPEGGILLLENLRFYPGEKQNSLDFAREIIDSTHAELFVQDGFAVVHRAHSSTSAIADLLPSVAGLLVEKEVHELSRVKNNPEQPFVLVIGGSKVEDKEPLIQEFLNKTDKIIVGGKIAADGYRPDAQDTDKIYVAEDFDEDGEGNKLDIGPISTMRMMEALQNAKTVLWNGVLGKVEDPTYATASTILAEFLGEHSEIQSIICGGDTTGFVESLQEGNENLQYSLISTGGGAALEFLTKPELPGLAVLE